MTHALGRILDSIKARRAARPVVIFDLDGTLYDNRPRTVRILHAFAAALPAAHARDASVILGLGPADLAYRLDETLAPRGVAPAVIDGAREAWVRRFFTDTACTDDVPHRGAVRFVRACYEAGATVVYLTGRDVPGMLVGTVRTLRDDGFPVGLPRVELVLKPTFEENDVVFKTRMLDPMDDELGHVVATFENEPGNCNLFHARWPEAVTVYVDTQHAPEAPALDPACVTVRDFEPLASTPHSPLTQRVRLDRLRKVWPDGTVALADVSLEVPAGQFVAVLGRSGLGKSTLLRCACRLVEPTSGRCFVGDTEITGARGRALARARARIGFVFQQFNLVRSYTALDNVLVARMSHVSYLRGLLGLWTGRDREVAARCLAEVGLEGKAGAPARELSGGQQQRVAVARAFAQEPAALFADEPTASLDPQLAATVMDLLRAYGRANEVPVLINVHTVEHARRFADRVLGLRAGRIVHDGPAAELTDAVAAGIYAEDA